MKFRHATFATAALAAAALALTGCGQDSAVVTVNGEKISKGELDNRLEGQFGKRVLQSLVQQRLVLQYAKNNNVQVADSEVDAQINKYKDQMAPGQFELMLQSQGMSLDDAKAIVRNQLIVKKAVDKNITITDKQLRDAFAKQPPQIHARHILVKTKADADRIEAQLRKGAKFEDLAKQYSLDPGSKAKGGDLGFFAAAQMVPPFSKAAFALRNPGDISPPVQSPFGWHVIQLVERGTFDNMKSKLRDQLLSVQEGTATTAFYNTLLSGAKIESSDPRFANLFPSPAPAGPAASQPPAATPAPTPTKKK